MLGQPQSMLMPEVIGFKLTGKLKEGVTATDLVLTVTQMLRKKGVVGKFVEFFGPGLDDLSLADRATIANMAPGIRRDLRLLPGRRRHHRLSSPPPAASRPGSRWSRPTPRRRACAAPSARRDPVFTDTLELDLGTVVPSLAGPKRPQDRVALGRHRRRVSPAAMDSEYEKTDGHRQALPGRRRRLRPRPRRRGDRRDHLLHQHLQPERADRRGPARPQRRRQGPEGRSPGSRPRWRPARRSSPNISTSPACRSRSRQARLQPRRLRLHHLHRQFRPAAASRSPRRSTTTTWSPPRCSRATATSRAASSPTCSANYLASPPLVVAYALAGTMQKDLDQGAARPRQERQAGLSEGHLADSARRSRRSSRKYVTTADVRARYADVFKGDVQLAQGQDAEGGRPTTGTSTRPMCRTRPISRA